MSEIVKVIIKSESGYCSYSDAYTDKVIIENNSISYEYKPMMISEDNPPIKWKYKTSNPAFEKAFDKISAKALKAINSGIDEIYCDIGALTFAVVYSDKTKTEKSFFVSGERFKDLLVSVKSLVPAMEEIPFAIRTYDEDEDWE